MPLRTSGLAPAAITDALDLAEALFLVEALLMAAGPLPSSWALSWPSDGRFDIRFSTDREPHGYKSGWWRCRRGQESSVRYAGQRHSLPCVWRNYGARYADWHGGRRPK